jgi:hypothetical protein
MSTHSTGATLSGLEVVLWSSGLRGRWRLEKENTRPEIQGHRVYDKPDLGRYFNGVEGVVVDDRWAPTSEASLSSCNSRHRSIKLHFHFSHRRFDYVKYILGSIHNSQCAFVRSSLYIRIFHYFPLFLYAAALCLQLVFTNYALSELFVGYTFEGCAQKIGRNESKPYWWYSMFSYNEHTYFWPTPDL